MLRKMPVLQSSVQGTHGAQGVWKSLADQRFHCIWVQFAWISSRKASQSPDFGGLKETARATPGPSGVTLASTCCRLPQHSPLQPWGPHLLGSRDVTPLTSDWPRGKKFWNVFLVCPMIGTCWHISHNLDRWGFFVWLVGWLVDFLPLFLFFIYSNKIYM